MPLFPVLKPSQRSRLNADLAIKPNDWTSKVRFIVSTAALDDGGHFVFPREWGSTAAIPRVTLRQPLATNNKPGSQFTPATKLRSEKDSASLQREMDPQESSFFAFPGFGARRHRHAIWVGGGRAPTSTGGSEHFDSLSPPLFPLFLPDAAISKLNHL